MLRCVIMTSWKHITTPLYVANARREQARYHWQQWCRHSKEYDFLCSLQQVSCWRSLLESIFSASPFLTRLLMTNMAFLNDFLQHDIKTAFDDLLARQTHALSPQQLQSSESLMRALRRHKQHSALVLALGEVSGLLPLVPSARVSSDFAQIAVRHCLDFLLHHKESALTQKDSGFVVLALGKLGARELNYASDIDVIFFYDDDHPLWRDRAHAMQETRRWGQQLVYLLGENTEDGMVARVDLRLRPDDGAVVMPLSAAERYYESRGRNWERAAFIKARCIAGDTKRGDAFVSYIQPFIWRRHLDFTALDDILSLTQSYHRPHDESLRGYHLKHGSGGIRAIETHLQCLQLIWGGRHENLRAAASLDALHQLHTMKKITSQNADALKNAYLCLRSLEHRLQMMNHQQTHTLPTQQEEFEVFACFAGYANGDALRRELTEHINRVERITSEKKTHTQLKTDITTANKTEDIQQWLTQQNMQDPEQMAHIISHWHHAHYPALSDERGRALFDQLLPSFLQEIARHDNQHQALARFDLFLQNLPAVVQLFALLTHHPPLLRLLAFIMSTAPRLAERLARRPQLLDNVLESHFYDEQSITAAAIKEEIKKVMKPHADLEQSLNQARIWAKDKKFQLGIHLLQNRITTRQAAPLYSHIADGLLEKILKAVSKPFVKQYGTRADDGMAIIALGTLGAQQLSGASDLDIIFLHDDATSMPTDSLAPTSYYTRLAQRLMTAISSATSEGDLYQLDTRLRPEGDKGLLTSSLSSFSRYQNQRARLWEHMALTKARVIAGKPNLRKKIEEIIHRTLTQKRDADAIRHDAHAMRKKIHKELCPRDNEEAFWSFKYRRGGMIDIDTIHQCWLLTHAAQHPDILHPQLEQSLHALCHHRLISAEDARIMTQAFRLWHELDGVVRLCHRSPFTWQKASVPLRQLLRHKSDCATEQQLYDLMNERADAIGVLYRRTIVS